MRTTDRASAHRKSELRTRNGLVKQYTSDVAHGGPRDRWGGLCVCSNTYKLKESIVYEYDTVDLHVTALLCEPRKRSLRTQFVMR